MKERAADVKDIGKRLLAGTKHVKLPDLGGITEPVIVVSPRYVSLGYRKDQPVSCKGNYHGRRRTVTSHVSILAKSMEIPTLVGVKGILSKVSDRETICMNAGEGGDRRPAG